MRKAGIQSQPETVEHLTLSWDKRESFGNAVGGNPSAGIVYAPTKKTRRKKKKCRGRKTPKARVMHQQVRVYCQWGEVVLYQPYSIRETERKFPSATKVELLTNSGIVLMSQRIGVGRIG